MTLKHTSPHSTKLLKSLRCQGQSNDCGAYTTATVLKALRGIDLEPDQLAREMEKPVRRGLLPMVRKIPNSATLPWGMVDVFKQHGLNAHWRFFSNTDYLKQQLDRGNVLMPIIGNWKPLWAHVMTLVDVDEEKGWGFANTQYEVQDPFWVADATFVSQWKAMGNLLVEVEVEAAVG
ncbi:MAG TPA: hypothetical protein PKM21_04480 [Anaerolineales bacterium]|nr:hypothetical protein [Anaerolineales bacterium]